MKLFTIACILTVVSASTAFSWDKVRLQSHCQVPNAGEAVVKATHFPFNVKTNKDILAQRFDELYQSGLRLHDRFYFDETTGKVLAPVYGGNAEVAEFFIESIASHLRQALKRKYADFAFFSDMGHNHYYIPEENRKQHSEVANKDRTILYTRMMADPDLKMLYHTAEQLTMVGEDKNVFADAYSQWRYYTRNIVGGNKAENVMEVVRVEDFSKFNTVRGYDDYRLYSGGVYIHATREGCFSYEHEGKTVFFDLSYTYFP